MAYTIDKNKNLLVLVESPNKVKKVSEYLSKLGYKATVMATIGHTTEIANNLSSYKNSGIWPDEGFRVDVQIAQDKRDVVTGIKQAAKKADLVIIASDPDREGENLGNHIKDLIGVDDDHYYRVSYHSITQEAIKKAIENPTKMDMNLVNAAEARQILDKLLGYSLSPISNVYVGARSVGRCQSAGLKLICDREHEILNFTPVTYYDIFIYFTKNNKKFKAKYIGTKDTPINHLTTRDEVINVEASCTDTYVVSDIVKRERHELPPSPFCTASFQQEANTKLNLSVKSAMSLAQKLFEGGFITYHRSDCQDIAPEFVEGQLKPFIEATFGKNSFVQPRKQK